MATSGLCTKRNCTTKIRTDSAGGTEIIIPATIDIGELNSTSIETLINQYEAGIVYFEKDYEPIKFITNQYGDTAFYLSVANLNTYIARDNIKVLIAAGGYPLLSERINSGVIFSPIEVARFILDLGYDPIGLSIGTSVVSNKIISELEGFYAENFSASSMGSFCSLLPSVFGAIDTFFNALDDAKNLINKLKNFSLEFSLKSLLDNLKKQIAGVIDKVVEKVKNAIENFSMENIISKVSTKLNQAVLSNFYELKEKAMQFFEAINIENFKKKIEALIDYATNIFKDPKIEEIQFLLFRFCSFISKVEEGINALKNPLDYFVNTYSQTVDTLKSNSAINTVRAVEAGGIRYSDTKTDAGTTEGAAAYTLRGNVRRIDNEEYKNLPRWNDGKGDSRIIFNGGYMAPKPRGMGDQAHETWTGADLNARVLLMRVQKEFGKQIWLTSGLRPKWYNDALRARGVKASLTSLHIDGVAFDCQWAGINSKSKEEFISIARKHGFGGIGNYSNPTFVHIDLGPTKSWKG